MAYRPPIVKPPRSPREVYQARLQRQALVQALSRRLVDLITQLAQGRSREAVPFEAFPGERSWREGVIPGDKPPPIVPPWRAPVPVPPVRVPTNPPVGPTHPVAASEEFLPRTWPPPSARDWVRLPGFYESGFLPDAAAPGDRF